MDLVDTYGPQQIITAVQRMADEDQARVVVSTVHKAKGREWQRVRIGNGFTPEASESTARPVHPAEARLIYVAVTRAREVLDCSGLQWAEAQISTASRAGATTTPEGIPLAALPLTGHLQYPRSPMSQFLDRHLPRTEQLISAYQ
ncbi:3'-5' exonuclease [Streptomyces galbus]|uniref:3'-5' exonuclease n=1 Tax=Streptomyces galbus TaxID=33898 RepID=UPI00382CE6EF